MQLSCLILSLFIFIGLHAQVTQKKFDSLPLSHINIPIQINLRPIAQMADKNVDTVFTSPNYPADWVQADCATRYKYHFRRSPFNMRMNGNTLTLGFTGFYQIIGATRACVSSTVLSPWTPACRCGFDEPERRVSISFNAGFKLLSNHTLITEIKRNEPVAIDKCTVCFWGQDVTTSVMEGIKADLDISRKAMADSFGRTNLKPYLQRAWNMMNEVYNIPGIGYFSLNPKKLRMENISGKGDLLNLNIGISATPIISLIKPDATTSPLPNLSAATNPGGFSIYLEAALQYDSLSKVLDASLFNKRFEVADGLFKKHIVIRGTEVKGNDKGELIITLDFGGSFDGTVYFTGKPVYNAEKKRIEVENMEYDLQTKNLLLKTARWMFSARIISELKKYSSFDLSNYYKTASTTINTWLNKEWTKGIKGVGSLDKLELTSLNALPQHLLIRTNCAGKLTVQVTEINVAL